MRSRSIRTLATGVGLAAMLGVVPATAASAATTHHRYAPTHLTLSVKSAHSKKHTVSLRCDPARGSHPHATDACQALTKARGKINKMPPREQFAACPMIYQPVTARAVGVWRGHTVSYQKTFANQCHLAQATGSLFDLTH